MHEIMNIQTIRNKYRVAILQIAKDCNASDIKIFGSVARGESTDESDIDFLVEMKPNTGIFLLGHLKWKLEELLHAKVDIVLSNSLHHSIASQVTKEAVSL